MRRNNASESTLDMVLASCLLAVLGCLSLVMVAASFFIGWYVGKLGLQIAAVMGAAW